MPWFKKMKQLSFCLLYLLIKPPNLCLTQRVSLNVIVSEMFSRSVGHLSGRRFNVDRVDFFYFVILELWKTCWPPLVQYVIWRTSACAIKQKVRRPTGSTAQSDWLVRPCRGWAESRPRGLRTDRALGVALQPCCEYDCVVLFKCVLKHGKQDEFQRTLPIKQNVSVNLKGTLLIFELKDGYE